MASYCYFKGRYLRKPITVYTLETLEQMEEYSQQFKVVNRIMYPANKCNVNINTWLTKNTPSLLSDPKYKQIGDRESVRLCIRLPSCYQMDHPQICCEFKLPYGLSCVCNSINTYWILLGQSLMQETILSTLVQEINVSYDTEANNYVFRTYAWYQWNYRPDEWYCRLDACLRNYGIGQVLRFFSNKEIAQCTEIYPEYGLCLLRNYRNDATDAMKWKGKMLCKTCLHCKPVFNDGNNGIATQNISETQDDNTVSNSGLTNTPADEDTSTDLEDEND